MIGLASVLSGDAAEIPLIEVLAPSAQDAAAINTVIESAGAQAMVCRTATEVGARFDEAISAVILVEEALDDDAIATLAECVQRQPSWSDIPIILLSGSKGRDGPQARWTLFRRLGNVSVLERPLHPQSLLIAIRSALRGRAWQRVVRKQWTISPRLRTSSSSAYRSAPRRCMPSSKSAGSWNWRWPKPGRWNRSDG